MLLQNSLVSNKIKGKDPIRGFSTLNPKPLKLDGLTRFPLLGGPFDLVGLVRWAMGDYSRVSRGY